jgi:hypothetical protein
MVKLLMTGVLVGHRLYHCDFYEYYTGLIWDNGKIVIDKITSGLGEVE